MSESTELERLVTIVERLETHLTSLASLMQVMAEQLHKQEAEIKQLKRKVV